MQDTNKPQTLTDKQRYIIRELKAEGYTDEYINAKMEALEAVEKDKRFLDTLSRLAKETERKLANGEYVDYQGIMQDTTWKATILSIWYCNFNNEMKIYTDNGKRVTIPLGTNGMGGVRVEEYDLNLNKTGELE